MLRTSLPRMLVAVIVALSQTAFAAEPAAKADKAAESTTNSLGMKLVLIPAGKFTMGTLSTEYFHQRDEEPRHEVQITKPFYLATTETTREQWNALMPSTPWKEHYYVEGANYAATLINWEEATEYCRKLSAKEGKKYRLPTEAEWEYACRAGSTTTYHFGNDAKQLGDYAWWTDNCKEGGETWHVHQVGRKKPNAFGLFDMHGNAPEWCSDWYADKYDELKRVDPQGPASGTKKIVRSGAYAYFDWMLRAGERNMDPPTDRGLHGFRVVLER